MCVCFIESKIAICLLSAATHSIQSQKPSNFQMHQEEDFQATHLKKKKKSRSQQAQSQNKELKKATKLPNISTFRSLWYTPLQ
jgi:hypothetical protein